MVERASGGIFLPHSRTDDTGVLFLNQFNRPLSIMSVLIWPVVVILARRNWRLATAAIGLYLACLFFFINIAAFAAIAVGAILFAFVYVLPKIGPIDRGRNPGDDDRGGPRRSIIISPRPKRCSRSSAFRDRRITVC